MMVESGVASGIIKLQRKSRKLFLEPLLEVSFVLTVAVSQPPGSILYPRCA